MKLYCLLDPLTLTQKKCDKNKRLYCTLSQFESRILTTVQHAFLHNRLCTILEVTIARHCTFEHAHFSFPSKQEAGRYSLAMHEAKEGGDSHSLLSKKTARHLSQPACHARTSRGTHQQAARAQNKHKPKHHTYQPCTYQELLVLIFDSTA